MTKAMNSEYIAYFAYLVKSLGEEEQKKDGVEEILF